MNDEVENPYGEVTSTSENLLVCPKSEGVEESFVTIGDIHGNALKLFYILIKKGVAQVNEDIYKQFMRFYYKPNPNKADIAAFKNLIDKLIINQNAPFIRILGDELADRGMNDFYTLYLLRHLHNKGVKYDINQSNHTIDFSLAAEKNSNDYRDAMGDNQSRSMANMGKLLKKNVITNQELSPLIEAHKLHQTIISYSLGKDDNKKISIYSHAPIGFEMIRSLAHKFEVPYKDGSAVELAATIEKINQKYLHAVLNKKLSTLINKDIMFLISALDSGRELSVEKRDYYAKNMKDNSLRKEIRKIRCPVSGKEALKKLGVTTKKYPLEFITWGRDYHNIERKRFPNSNLDISYVHGHDSSEINRKEHIFCLDNQFGKGDAENNDIQNPILHQNNRLLSDTEKFENGVDSTQTELEKLANCDYLTPTQRENIKKTVQSQCETVKNFKELPPIYFENNGKTLKERFCLIIKESGFDIKQIPIKYLPLSIFEAWYIDKQSHSIKALPPNRDGFLSALNRSVIKKWPDIKVDGKTSQFSSTAKHLFSKLFDKWNHESVRNNVKDDKEYQKSEVLEGAFEMMCNKKDFSKNAKDLNKLLHDHPKFNATTIRRQSKTMTLMLKAIDNNGFLGEVEKNKLKTIVQIHAHLNKLAPKQTHKKEMLKASLEVLVENKDTQIIKDKMIELESEKPADEKFDSYFIGESHTEKLVAQSVLLANSDKDIDHSVEQFKQTKEKWRQQLSAEKSTSEKHFSAELQNEDTNFIP